MSTLVQALTQADVSIDKEKFRKLDHFSALLLEWNGVHNLSGVKSKEQQIEYIVDALYPTSFIETPTTMLDVGTGAGFPGLILAIFYDGCAVTLCEPLKKRSAFLRYVSAEIDLVNVTVETKRVQDIGSKPFDLITSRAVGSLPLLVTITKHLRNDQSRYLLYKGSRLDQEMEALKEKINYTIVQRGQRQYLYIKECRCF